MTDRARELVNDPAPHPDYMYVLACKESLDLPEWQPNRAVWADLCDTALKLIEQTLTPPEGDTVSEGVVEALAVRIVEHAVMELDADEENHLQINAFGEAVERELRDVLAALQSRVSPQADEVERWKQKLLAVASERDRLAQHREQLIEELAEARSSPQAGMREALEQCRDRFADYVEFHRARLPVHWANAPKDWRDVAAKIELNEEMVALCDAALSTAPIPMSENVVA